uniref:Uncharacterized protein n=1 Tax=Arabidopsis thaliana TaxID=3702 RepID=Q0WN33_ARATH|nr:hypothetical protein [Arabidopsis thaliana]
MHCLDLGLVFSLQEQNQSQRLLDGY